MRARFHGLLAIAFVAAGGPSAARGASLGIPALRLPFASRGPATFRACAAEPALLTLADGARPYVEPPTSTGSPPAPASTLPAEPPVSSSTPGPSPLEPGPPAEPPLPAEPPAPAEPPRSAEPPERPASRPDLSATPPDAARGDALRVTPARAARAFGLAAAGVAANDALAALLLALGWLDPGAGGEALVWGAGFAMLGPGLVASSLADRTLQRRGRQGSWPVHVANFAAAGAALLVAHEAGLDERQGIALFLGIQLVVVPGTAVAWSALSPPRASAPSPASPAR